MSSFLQNLENNEAILLMYLANELPADDRAEVEQMLKYDATLRAQLQALRDAYHQFDQTMLLGDASNVLPSGYMTAVTFGKTVQERFAAKPRSVDDHEGNGRRMHWAIYPAAAAAMLAIGMLFWWKSASDEMKRPTTPMVDRSFGSGPFSGGGMGPGRGDFRNWGPGGYPMWTPPMVDFASVASGNPADLSDEAIVDSFEPIVYVSRLSPAQRQLIVLDYMDQSWQ